MSVSIKYGDFKFIGNSGYPTPLITISREFQRNGAGQQVGSTTRILLEGKIFSVNNPGSGYHELVDNEKKLRNIFGIDGSSLIINCGDNQITKFDNIKINKYDANKTENNWVTTIDYAIDCTSEDRTTTTGTDSFYVSSVQEDWSIEPVEELSYTLFNNLSLLGLNNSLSHPSSNNFQKYPLYKISRTYGAVGKYIPSGTDSLTNAKAWVDYHLSLNNYKVTGIVHSSLNLYNFVRNINKSFTEGSYKVTDTWLAGSGISAYTESFTVETSLDANMVRNVDIKGTVKGLEPYNTGISDINYGNSSNISGIYPTINNNFRVQSMSKFFAASSGYSGIKEVMFNRAQSFLTASIKYPSGSDYRSLFGQSENIVLNPIPVSITEGINPLEGTINYSYSYNNRPINAISGSISENLTITDNKATPIVASIFVIGRTLGPILQDLGTKTSSTRRVSFEVVLPTTGVTGIVFPFNIYNQMSNIIDNFAPTGTNMISNIKNNTSNWSITENRFSREKTWEYVYCS